jgi:hypothetical protein
MPVKERVKESHRGGNYPNPLVPASAGMSGGVLMGCKAGNQYPQAETMRQFRAGPKNAVSIGPPGRAGR